MTPTPPDPPPPPPSAPGPAPYPGTGYQGAPGANSQATVYTWDATPPGRIRTAALGARAGAFVVDHVLLSILPAIALFVIREGGRDVRSCELTAEGNIAVFGQDGVTSGLCEYPSGSAIAISATVFLVGVAVWFLHSAREGRSGTTVGKSLVGIRTVDRRTLQPVGAGRGIGRGLVRGLLGWGTLGAGFVVDHLWPLWDRDQQTLHDKVASSVVVPADTADPAGGDDRAGDRSNQTSASVGARP